MQTQASQTGRAIGLQIESILHEEFAGRPAGRRRPHPARGAFRRPCDGCGGRGHDVDLWAEDSETGEQIWLCPVCGDS